MNKRLRFFLGRWKSPGTRRSEWGSISYGGKSLLKILRRHSQGAPFLTWNNKVATHRSWIWLKIWFNPRVVVNNLLISSISLSFETVNFINISIRTRGDNNFPPFLYQVSSLYRRHTCDQTLIKRTIFLYTTLFFESFNVLFSEVTTEKDGRTIQCLCSVSGWTSGGYETHSMYVGDLH